MDIGRTRARATTTGTTGDKEKQRAEGCCYKCNKQGHISCICPQWSEGSSSTIAATVALNSSGPISNQQRVQAYLATLHNEPEEVRTTFADVLFVDFLDA